MPKYLYLASYTNQGLPGLLKEGGTGRRTAVQQALEGFGCKLEAFYYAFGETDLYVIVDAPDNEAAAAVSLAVNAPGTADVKTVVLMTPEEMDNATKKVDEASKSSTRYRPPGG